MGRREVGMERMEGCDGLVSMEDLRRMWSIGSVLSSVFLDILRLARVSSTLMKYGVHGLSVGFV